MEDMEVGDVVQFNENHKWTGCLGIIDEINDCGKNGKRYMVALPLPQQGTAYIFVMPSEFAIEKIGKARFVTQKEKRKERIIWEKILLKKH